MTELDTVPLGRTGLRVSEMAFGTWRFGRETGDGAYEADEDQAYELLDAYESHGGRFVDTADVYGDGRAEDWIGNWLAERDREDFVVASKVFWPAREDDPNGRSLTRKHLRRQVDAILDRLGTDYLDVLYCHRFDDRTPVPEFMRTLNGLVEEGKVNHLGASTLRPNAWRVTLANEIADRRGWEPFRVVQPRFNVIDREIEGNYLDMVDHYDLALMPWSPLAWGFLTGKYTREDADVESMAAADDRFADTYLTEENFEVLDVVRNVADEVDASPTQVALAWLCHHPDVTAPIIGARTPEQLAENVAAADVDLSDEQFERLREANAKSLLGDAV